MKKITTFSFVFTFLGLMLMALTSHAQVKENGNTIEVTRISTILDQTQASDALPAIIDDLGTNRGASFNGEYIFVASRQDGDQIYYWDIDDPSTVNELTIPEDFISGGLFTLNDLTTVGDQIFVTNMANSEGDDFKIYHWESVNDDNPSVLVEHTLGAGERLGDAFTVMGDMETWGTIVVSNWGTKEFYAWEFENDVWDENPTVYLMEDLYGNTNFGRATLLPNLQEPLLSGPGFGWAVYDENEETFPVVMEPDFFPAWAMYPMVFEFNGERHLAYNQIGTSPVENKLVVLHIDEGNDAIEALDLVSQGNLEDFIVHTVDLGDVASGNASTSVDIYTDEDGDVYVFSYVAGNGFILQKVYTEVIEAYELPFVENFDGEGEDTPADWMPEGWLNLDEDGDGHKWYWEDYGDPDTEGYETFMLSRSFDGEDALDPDNWLISPAIYMGTVDEGEMIEMTFHVAPAANTPVFRTERYEVLISTTDNDPESFTMIWEETLTEETPQWGWQVRNLDLTDYAGETVHLAIRHYDSADNDRIALEKVEVKVVEETEPGLIYSISLPLEAGEVPYKYFVVFDEPSWEHGEWDGDPNRTVMVEGDMIVEDVWGDQPEEENGDNGEEDKENNQFIVTFKVDMADVMFYETDEEGDTISSFAFDPEEHHVFIAGGFGGDIDWNEPGSNPDLELTIGDDGVVSVQEPIIEQTAINVFPNPARNNFTVTSESMIQQVVVSDITGRTVQSLQTNGHEVNLNASGLGNGVYIISVYTENGVSVTKLQVQQ